VVVVVPMAGVVVSVVASTRLLPVVWLLLAGERVSLSDGEAFGEVLEDGFGAGHGEQPEP